MKLLQKPAKITDWKSMFCKDHPGTFMINVYRREGGRGAPWSYCPKCIFSAFQGSIPTPSKK